MRLEDRAVFSYYRTVADISEKHGVQLVQHTETGKFFVKKCLTVYNAQVLHALQQQPVPGMPQIYALAEDESGMHLIEEYIQGDTLQELLDREGPFPEERALDLTIQLCGIVSHLHHRTPPIVHRDIKPSNVMLSPDGVVKLLDLNAAKFADNSEHRDTVLLGTVGYAAPEQYGFSASTVQADLYSIGVLLNVLLTGSLPTEQSAKGQCASVIARCTQMNPEDRYASVDELQTVLSSLRSGAPVFSPSGPPKPHKHSNDWKRFLPPGFRTGSPMHMVLGVIGYVLILLFCLYMSGRLGRYSLLRGALDGIVFAVILLFVVFFSANYCGVQRTMPLTRSNKPFVRLLGVLLYDVLVAALLIFVRMLVDVFLR